MDNYWHFGSIDVDDGVCLNGLTRHTRNSSNNRKE